MCFCFFYKLFQAVRGAGANEGPVHLKEHPMTQDWVLGSVMCWQKDPQVAVISFPTSSANACLGTPSAHRKTITHTQGEKKIERERVQRFLLQPWARLIF